MLADLPGNFSGLHCTVSLRTLTGLVLVQLSGIPFSKTRVHHFRPWERTPPSRPPQFPALRELNNRWDFDRAGWIRCAIASSKFVDSCSFFHSGTSSDVEALRIFKFWRSRRKQKVEPPDLLIKLKPTRVPVSLLLLQSAKDLLLLIFLSLRKSVRKNHLTLYVPIRRRITGCTVRFLADNFRSRSRQIE